MSSLFIPGRNRLVEVDVRRYRKQLLQNLSMEGTSFTNRLGTFYLKIKSHNPAIAMQRLGEAIQNAQEPLEFEYESYNTVICEYSLLDELYDQYPDSDIVEYDNGKVCFVGVYFFDKSPSIYFRKEETELIPSTKEEYRKMMP